jgi:hypothetical protein
MGIRASHWDALVVAALIAALGGCSGIDPTDPEYGTVTAAVVYQDTENGVTYRLPLGTFVRLTTEGHDSDFLLDSDASEVTFEVPVGDYTASLFHAQQYLDFWPLERVEGGAATTVQATLTTPSLTLAVGPADTTLVFMFFVPGAIEFPVGGVEVGFTVAEGLPIGAEARFTGEFVASPPVFAEGASAELRALFPAALDTAQMSWSARVGSDWIQQSPVRVCADLEEGSLDGAVVGFPVEGSSALAEELEGGEGTLCLMADGVVTLTWTRTGFPMTTTFLDALGSGPFMFAVQAEVMLAPSAFAEGRLDFQKLIGGHPTEVTVRHYVFGDDLLYWGNFTDTTTGVFAYTPY